MNRRKFLKAAAIIPAALKKFIAPTPATAAGALLIGQDGIIAEIKPIPAWLASGHFPTYGKPILEDVYKMIETLERDRKYSPPWIIEP